MAIAMAQDLIRAALRRLRSIQSGEPMDATVAADCLDDLNLLIDSWNNEVGMCFADQTQQIAYLAENPALGNAYQLTVGPGGQFNCTRPQSLIRARVVDISSGNILPQALITQEEFDIAIRQQPSSGSYPYLAWYDPQMEAGGTGNGLGVLNLWPNPSISSGNFQQWIRFRGLLSAFASLTSSALALPPGYSEALVVNLAVRIAPSIGASAVKAAAELIDPDTKEPLAGTLKARLKAINSQQRARVLSPDLQTNRNGLPNILNNTTNPG